jgi:endo-1,4-beta-mannosidase
LKDQNRFLVGINYWPKETAMYWWQRFDPSIVKRDFSLLAEYRFDIVRIFLLWGDFEPEIRRVSVASLEHLVQVTEAAHDARLQLLPTFFTGHMSGVNWLPPWMLTSGSERGRFSVFTKGETLSVGIRNMYSDREIWKAQKLLLHETTGALQGHPAVWGWDLGNEPSNLMVPPSRDAARAWLEEMVLELKRYDSDIPVTMGLHQEDLKAETVLGPREVGQFCDILSMHAYPCYAEWADGPLDEKAPLFLAHLTAWLGNTEVLMEAFGVPTKPDRGTLSQGDRETFGRTDLMSEDDAEVYYRRVFDLLAAAGFPGAFAWCFSDYEPALWDVPPLDDRVHERFFGLFRWDGSPKEAAKTIPTIDRRIRKRESHPDWIDMKPDEYYERPAEHLQRLYHRFKDRFEEG